MAATAARTADLLLHLRGLTDDALGALDTATLARRWAMDRGAVVAAVMGEMKRRRG